MHDLHQELLSKNALYRKWHSTPHHRVMHWALLVIVATALTNGVLNAINVTYVGAQTTGVHYTFDINGIQSLTYNGQSYLSNLYGMPYEGTQVVTGALFKAPDGTLKPYGWLANSLDQNLSLSSALRTTGNAPDFDKQIYRSGKADSFTVNWNYSAPDSRTFKVDIAVTNNDPVDTLTQIGLEYFMSLAVPRPLTKEVPYPGANLAVGGGGLDTPTAFLQGAWGSVAAYTDKYNTNWEFGSATNNYDDASASQVAFLLVMRNGAIAYGDPSNQTFDPISPGQTVHYTFYLRFGSSSDTPATLAPEAYSAYRSGIPYLVNWTDRRPIARWFMGKGAEYGSATNPRSYLWDPSINVFDQASFSAKVLAETDSNIAVMNSMNPKPQGVVIWDLEGDEFFQYFTYVGYPNKLHDLAPEMDAVADQMFQKFKNAGYLVGMTLRPGDFQTGTLANRPSTCFSSATNVDLDDIYIATDGIYPNRGYTCTSTNTWTNTYAHHPYHQHSPQDDATLLANLRSKVAYAHNRWGSRLFYVDSTVYSGNGGGNPFNYNVFRKLQQEFPDVLFMPENEATSYFGATAPYNQTNPDVGGGVFDTPSEARNIYPQAFSVLANYDGVNFTDPVIHDKFLASIRSGNIYMVYSSFLDPSDAQVLALYREAGTTGTTTDSVSPVVSISSPSNGGTVSGFAVVNALATDNIAVTRVEFWKDGILNTTLTNSPYNFSWNTSGDTNGPHTVQVKAYDAAGNIGVSAITNVTVSNVVTPPQDTIAPVTSITSLTNNSTVSGNITVSATASDNVGVTRVELWKDGALNSTLTTSPYTFSWNTTAVANGSHTLQSKAYDAAGNVGVSTIVNVTVSNVVTPPPPPPPPPADTTPPSAPGGITVSVTAQPAVNIAWTPSTDDVAVTGYKVFRNGSQIASITSTSYTDTAVSAGSAYDYTVTASDAAGNVSVPSDTASVTIPNPQATNVSITSNSVSKKTANTTTIVWVTNVPSTGVLRYGTSASNLNLSIQDISSSLNHAVILTGLTKSTKYYYQITATAVTGGSTDSSSVTMWRTQPK